MGAVRTSALSAFGQGDITFRYKDSQRNVTRKFVYEPCLSSLSDMSQNAVIGSDASCRFFTNREGLAQPKIVIRIVHIPQFPLPNASTPPCI